MATAVHSAGCARFGYELFESSPAESSGTSPGGAGGANPTGCAAADCPQPDELSGTGGSIPLDSGTDASVAIDPDADAGLTIPTSCTNVVADSVVDFSSTQGQGGWFYGFYVEPDLDSSAFQELTLYEYVPAMGQSIWRFGDQAWTWIGARAQHPHGINSSGVGKLSVNHHVVRRWLSPTTQGLFIQGTIRAQDISESGVTAHILVENTEHWQQYIAPNQATPTPFELGVSVQAGGTINFTIEPFESNDVGDATEFMFQLCN